MRRRTAGVSVLMGLMFVPGVWSADCETGWREHWSQNEESYVRTVLLPGLEDRPDYQELARTLDAALNTQPATEIKLRDLVASPESDIASAAVALLARYPSEQNKAFLRQLASADARVPVRNAALGALLRLSTPDIGALLVQALGSSDEELRAGASFLLRRTRDPQYGAALLNYAQGSEDRWQVFEWVGCLGDPPGATAVRDGLLALARDSGRPQEARLAAALGLEEMGQGALVKDVLDRERADQTHQTLVAVRASIVRAARMRGQPVRNGADAVDLFHAARISRKIDEWGRDLRIGVTAKSDVVVTSDGPDRLPDTVDDLSSEESLSTWLWRRSHP